MSNKTGEKEMENKNGEVKKTARTVTIMLECTAPGEYFVDCHGACDTCLYANFYHATF